MASQQRRRLRLTNTDSNGNSNSYGDGNLYAYRYGHGYCNGYCNVDAYCYRPAAYYAYAKAASNAGAASRLVLFRCFRLQRDSQSRPDSLLGMSCNPRRDVLARRQWVPYDVSPISSSA